MGKHLQEHDRLLFKENSFILQEVHRENQTGLFFEEALLEMHHCL